MNKPLLDADRSTDPSVRRAFVWSSFGFAAVIFVYLLEIYLLTGQVRLGMIIGFFAVACFAVLGIWSLLLKKIAWPATVFAAVMLICSTSAAAINGGADGYVAPFLMMTPIAACYFLSVRSSLIFGSLSILCVLGLHIADANNLVTESPLDANTLRLAATLVLCSAIALALVTSTFYSRQLSLSAHHVEHNQTMLASMSEVAHVGAWEIDLQENRPIWSDQMRRIYEVDPDFYPTTEQVVEFFKPEGRDTLNEAITQCVEKGTPFDLELPLVTAKGKHIWVRTVGNCTLRNGKPSKIYGALQDITEQRKERASLAKALKKADEALSDLSAYQSALDEMAIVAVTDTSGAITFANKRFCEISGYDRDDLIGVNHRIVNSGHHSKEFFADMWDTIGSGRPWQGEICNRSRDGQLYWVDTMIIPICDLAGEPKSYVSIRYDVTDRVVNAEELESRRRDAEAANDAKSQFLANMSHEIRTPLNGVLGMAQLLERTDLDEKQKRYTKTIRTSGAALLSLINDVLDISKIEAGLMNLDPVPFDLEELLQEVVESVAGIAAQKKLAVQTNKLFSGPGRYLGDNNRIRQILINLAGNAIKFTEEGGITITAEKTEDGLIRFAVTDSGPGIPVEQQKAIFERFVQADGSVTRKHGGTGLGLAISQDLVALMGGHIGVDSVPGEGATFWFTLPLRSADENLEAGIEDLKTTADIMRGDAPAPARVPSLRVLLAEDNPINQQLIEEALSTMDAWDIDLTTVENGLAAVNALKAGTFDIVLMDINMPVMNGEEAMRRIRASGGAHADVPIIAITANALTGQCERYLRAGANAYLAKPVDLDQLQTTLSELATAAPETSNVA